MATVLGGGVTPRAILPLSVQAVRGGTYGLGICQWEIHDIDEGYILTRWNCRRCSNLCALDSAEGLQTLENRCYDRVIALAEKMLGIGVKGYHALRPFPRLVL